MKDNKSSLTLLQSLSDIFNFKFDSNINTVVSPAQDNSNIIIDEKNFLNTELTMTFYEDSSDLHSHIDADEGSDSSEDFSVLLENEYDDTNTGEVISFKDSVVTIHGLKGVKANELIFFEGGASGIALNLEYSIVKALVFGGPASVSTLEKVTRSNSVMNVPVGEKFLGRIVDALGDPVDGLGLIGNTVRMPIERKAPGVVTRKKIQQPVVTGLKVVDALVPIGRGQRELILGDRKTGKTTIAIDAILHQITSKHKFSDTLSCVYVAIGKRMSEIVRLRNLLRDRGALPYTVLMVARSSDPTPFQFIAPYAACTMAEFFTYRGKSALIVYDDLTRHADAYRQISLLLRRPVGREAYPGDIFYLHSRLLERAVKLNSKLGGGSLTALPIVETVQGDVSAYIPTNVISITDGQIYLDLNRHQEGIRPAVDPGLSVSRVGSSAQARLMKKLAGSLKLELAQFREVEQFSKFGSELDEATRQMLVNGRLMVQLMMQPRNATVDIYEQALILMVAKSEFFKKNVLNSGCDLVAYYASLITFIRASTVCQPARLVLETQAGAQANDVLNFMFSIHFRFFHINAFTRANPISIADTLTTAGNGAEMLAGVNAFVSLDPNTQKIILSTFKA